MLCSVIKHSRKLRKCSRSTEIVIIWMLWVTDIFATWLHLVVIFSTSVLAHYTVKIWFHNCLIWSKGKARGIEFFLPSVASKQFKVMSDNNLHEQSPKLQSKCRDQHLKSILSWDKRINIHLSNLTPRWTISMAIMRTLGICMPCMGPFPQKPWFSKENAAKPFLKSLRFFVRKGMLNNHKNSFKRRNLFEMVLSIKLTSIWFCF